MTSTEPMTYKPGPELDAIVSEKVLGRLLTWNRQFQYLTDEESKTDIRSFKSIPEYSTTWEGMRLVVEEMMRREYSFKLGHMIDQYTASFLTNEWNHVGRSSEAPHAVCLAALSALQHVSHTDGLGDRDD